MSYYTKDYKYVAGQKTQAEYNQEQQISQFQKIESSWQDFGSTRYNSSSGETVIKDPTTGEVIYRYNPATSKTTYNGTDYAGKLDPSVLGSVTGDQVSTEWDKLIEGQQKLADQATGVDLNDDWKGQMGQGTADAYVMSNTYNAAKQASGNQPSLFDTLKQLSDQRQTAQSSADSTPQPGPGQMNYKDWYASGGAQKGSYKDYLNPSATRSEVSQAPTK